MSKLTEIMKQIPLDELMGDTVITNTETKTTEQTGENTMNNEEMRTNITQSKGAYAKRTGALVSAAAIALVAIGGAFAFSKLSGNTPETSNIEVKSSVSNEVTSRPASSAAPAVSAANKTIFENYVKNKPELQGTGCDICAVTVDVDANCSYGLYRIGGSSVLCRISGGKVTEYTEILSLDPNDASVAVPCDIYGYEIFEIGGKKFAALLTDITADGGYSPAVLILEVDGSEPKAAFGYYRLNLKRYTIDAKVEYETEHGVDVYSIGDMTPSDVVSIKDVMKFGDTSIVIEGVEYDFADGRFTPAYRVILNSYIDKKEAADDFPYEPSEAFTTTTANKYAYGAYYDRRATGGSIICKISGKDVEEYCGYFKGSNSVIPGRIYDMCNTYIGDNEFLVVLADKATNGGIAPMVFLLDITDGSPKAVMSEPVMIDMTHYEKDAQSFKDGDTTIYGVSNFDSFLSRYFEPVDGGVKIDGRTFTFKDGVISEVK